MNEELINNVLSDFSTFTKEEYEIINTYITKKEAEYEKKRADRIAETDVKYLVKRKYVDKYYEKGLKHKEMLINNAMEEFNAHKEILLQCLSILQSLVNNPNVVNFLIDLINLPWYGDKNLREVLTDIIYTEKDKLNDLHDKMEKIRNCPVLLFIPELYASSHDEIASLPAYTETAKRLVVGYRDMTDNNYPFLP